MMEKIGSGLIVLVIIILCFTFSAAAEEYQQQERLELIKASQQLMEEQEFGLAENRLGLFVTNFGSDTGEVNLGGRLEIPILNQSRAKFLIEGIHLKEEESLAGFLSLKVIPKPEDDVSFYLGTGREVTGTTDYQVFAGVDIFDNLFIEAKYINEIGNFSYDNFYPAVGFQLAF